MKAPAKKTTNTGKPAAKGAVGRASASVGKVSSAAKPVAKSGGKVLATKPASKPVAKSGKASAVAKKAVAPAKRVASSKTTSPVKKAVPSKGKVVSKPVAKASAKAPVKAGAKSAVKTPAVKSTTKLPSKAPPTSVTKTVSKAIASKTSPEASKATGARSAQKPAAAPVVQPTPRPLGKRAAKKMMMEQMTQAAVVPTHAPDAAKATFSTMNERAVMAPPVPTTVRKDPKRANNWKTVPVEQLTDEDVQAMPDDEYMGDLQLAYFRRKLCQLRDDMLANAGETTEHLREDTVVVPDPADRATIEEEHALELRTRDRERKLLKKISQAIIRIDSGEYGYCEETGEAIGVGRLMARPTASLSLEAQQRRELKQKMFGD